MSGFPNFHETNYGPGVVRGTFLLSADIAEWRDVPASEWGNPRTDESALDFVPPNDWAARNGLVAGFSNFHQADHGQGIVYGTILFRPGEAEWRDVLADVLGIFSRFTFDGASRMSNSTGFWSGTASPVPEFLHAPI